MLTARPWAITRSVVDALAPRERPPVSEWADEHVVTPDTGARYSLAMTPYMREPMDACDDRGVTSVCFVGPSRSAKTLSMIIAPALHGAAHDVHVSMIVRQAQQDADDFGRDDWERAASACEPLAKIVPTGKARSIRRWRFRSGAVVRISYASSTNLSGKTLKRVLLSDGDNWTSHMQLGDAWPLAKKRTASHMSSGVAVVEGNPAVDYIDDSSWSGQGWTPSSSHDAPPVSGLVGIYLAGDRRQLYWPCQRCGEYSRVSPGLAVFEAPEEEAERRRLVMERAPTELAAEWGRVRCRHCDRVHTMADRSAMLTASRWLRDGEAIDRWGVVSGEPLNPGRDRSYWLGGAAAAFAPWPDLMRRYIMALRDDVSGVGASALKQVTNTDLADVYRRPGKVGARSVDGLAIEVGGPGRGEVPEGATLIGAVDVQGDSFEAALIARSAGRILIVDRWSIDVVEGQRCAPAVYAAHWDAMRRIMLERGPAMLVIDSGGEPGVTDQAIRAARRWPRDARVRLCKGEALTVKQADGRPLARPGTFASGEAVMLVNTVLAKDEVAADLQAGRVSIPAWLSADHRAEISAEQRSATGWVKVARRNETWDLLAMAKAALWVLDQSAAVAPITWRPARWG